MQMRSFLIIKCSLGLLRSCKVTNVFKTAFIFVRKMHSIINTMHHWDKCSCANRIVKIHVKLQHEPVQFSSQILADCPISVRSSQSRRSPSVLLKITNERNILVNRHVLENYFSDCRHWEQFQLRWLNNCSLFASLAKHRLRLWFEICYWVADRSTGHTALSSRPNHIFGDAQYYVAEQCAQVLIPSGVE